MGDFEFERLVAYFDADLGPLDKKTKSATKLIDNLEKRIKNFKGKLSLTTGNGPGGAGSIDRELRQAEANIRRFQADRTRGETGYTRIVEREARQQANARTREQRRASNAFLADMRRVNAEEKKQSRGALSGFGGKSAFMGGLIGGGSVLAAFGLTGTLSSIASEGREAYVSLEKLVRFTSTLDRSFQTPANLTKFRKDIEALTLEIPQSAENIAKASFTVKSAYSRMTEPELIAFLRKLGVQATASNTTIDLHADRVAAMAKMYKITADELDTFGAIISTSFGDALATDAAVGEGFNKILISARSVKQPLNEVAAAMGAIQSTSSDAEKNTTNLQNVFAKLGDPKYIKGLKDVFKIDIFDAKGQYKGLNAIVNELSKSMQGLSDKEKSLKIGKVFKDLQAREGLMALMDVLEQYNTRLRDGADQETWAAKQATMLNSADAKWQLFVNKMDGYKRSIGKSMIDPIAAAQDSQTAGGGWALWLGEMTRLIDSGGISVAESIVNAQRVIGGEIERGFGVSPATIDKVDREFKSFFDNIRGAVDTGTETTKLQVLQSQKKWFEALAGDPQTLEATKRAAVEKIAALTTTIAGQAEILAAENFKSYKKATEQVAEGIKAGTPGASQQALELQVSVLQGMKVAADSGASQETIESYRRIILALGAVVEAAGADQIGQTAGTQFGTGVQTGVEGKQGDVASAANALLPATSPDASAKGLSLGQQFAMGIASGIRSGGGHVGAAVASIIDWAFSSGKAAQESQSPSERAARELGLPFAQGIAMGLSGPKAKVAIKQSLKQLFDDLVYEAGRIETTSGQDRGVTERFFEAMLGDESAGYTRQLDRIEDYYDELYRIENEKYAKRLANITKQEELIRQRKDLKPEEKRTMLRGLGDQRTDTTADRTDAFSGLGKDRNAAISEAGMRRIELASRALARSITESENSVIGVRRTAEAEAQANYANELKRIDDRITRYKTERDTWAEGTAEYVKWNNRVIDAIEDRKDAEVQGSAEVKRARLSDRQSLEDLARSIIDFTSQTAGAQMDAEDQKIEYLRASGASKEAVFIAEMNLALRRETFQHSQRENEIRRAAQQLRDTGANAEQLIQINATMNAQLEAEGKRHNDAMATITASQGQHSILGQWKQIAAQLPTYQEQLKSFAVSLPETIGNVFGQALQSFDGTWKGFLSSLKEAFFRTLQEMLAELFRMQLIKGLVGLLGAVFGAAGGAASGGGGGGGGHTVWGGGHAEGGVPPMNRVSLVGENGPELFIPRVAGRVLSHEDSMKAVAGRGRAGDVYNLTVNNINRGPRGLVNPKSTRQQTEAAVTGLTYATKGRRQ